VASRANGVVTVRNNLAVSYPSTVYYYEPYSTYPPFYSYWDAYRPYHYSTWSSTSDAEINADIHDEMWCSPFVSADQVTVKVENRVATLTGTVDSWPEYRAATENAYEGGAWSVINNLKVK